VLESPGREMPVYEYRCNACRRMVSIYQQRFAAPSPPCPCCGSSGLIRVFSTFAVQKTFRDVYEDILSDSGLTQGMMRDDPRAMAEWNRRMSGGEKPPPEYEELTGRMERGEWPAAQVERKRRELSAQGEHGTDSG
jgi:putative FmdB family regulatory protein